MDASFVLSPLDVVTLIKCGANQWPKKTEIPVFTGGSILEKSERSFVQMCVEKGKLLEELEVQDMGDPELVIQEGHGVTKQHREVTLEEGRKKLFVDLYHPLESCSGSDSFRPNLCWQTEDQGETRTWFQCQHDHGFKTNLTVVLVSGMHNLVDGFHLVGGAFPEQGKDSVNLFYVLGIKKLEVEGGIIGNNTGLVQEICYVNASQNVVCVEQKNEIAQGPLPLDLEVEVEVDEDVDVDVDEEEEKEEEEEEEEEKEKEEEEEEEEDLVPFDAESYGLQECKLQNDHLEIAAKRMKLELSNELSTHLQSSRFVVHGNESGFVSEICELLGSGINRKTLMQRGSHLCIVLQRLTGLVLRCLEYVPTSNEFQGGVLLSILFCLDEIYRKKQINTTTMLVEDAPPNIFAHMDGTIETAASVGAKIVSMSGVNRTTPLTVPAPYVADVEMPELENISIDKIRSLFKNAPHLDGLQKEMTTPKSLRKIDGYIGQKKSGKLRKYQDHCVKKVKTGANFVFVAPTGAGKTRIFVEAARHVLENNNHGTVVVICPTVPLATQQASVFVVEGFLQDRFWVNVFSSDNQMPPETWKFMQKSHNVMVMTPQLMLNVMEYLDEKTPLEEGNAIFHDIDLLVLDECHHTRKEHPFNKIMRQYKATEGSKMQVLGFTASPAKSKTEDECREQLSNLLDSLDAFMVVITEENEEVKAHVPGADEIQAWTEPRPEDVLFARALGKYIFRACRMYLLPLVGIVKGVRKQPENCMVEFQCGKTSPFFESWVRTCGESLEEQNPTMVESEKNDLLASFDLVRCCNTALDLLTDAGFESALKYLAMTASRLSMKFIKETKWSLDELMFRKLLCGLYCIQPIQHASTVLHAFHVSPDGLNKRFPRFVELVKFLLGYSKQELFHGIVFVKTRDGVYHLASMLRNHPQLRFITPIEFIGHGRTQRKNSTKAAYLHTTAASSAVRGMTGSKQRETLEAFSKPGRHVLIATSAAEEGINVPTCEFVVRYSVTETGIQRVQSRGRTRVRGAVFLNILERESKSSELYHSAVRQEEILNRVLGESEYVERL